MKKNIFIYFAAMAMAILFTACGSDDPVVPRDRDVTMTISTLTHLSNLSTGQANIAVAKNNTFVFHPKTLTLDMQLEVPINGTSRTFSITGIPVTAVEYTYRYTFDETTCSNAEVTNLKGIVNITDPMAILQCDIAGYHVCMTIPSVFFERNVITFNYSDESKSTHNNGYWAFTINETGTKADISINDLLISKDIMIDATGKRSRSGRFFTSINGSGANVTVTTKGIKITADEIGTTATYGNVEQTQGTYKTDNYPIYNLTADIDLTTGKYTASMVIRHILTRDQDTKAPTEWDDINVEAAGSTFKDVLN